MPPRRLDLDTVRAALDAQLIALDEPPYDGPDRLDHVLATLVAAVARAYDGGADPERDAVRLTVRHLLDRLALRAPGRSVEVRVPPYAAVQCVEGPRHTRGTPPNVIEMAPRTWIELATGRLTWAEAVIRPATSASGPRADLSPYVPVD
ncbi:hypothetical protein SAMN05421505_13051 [Sinosporangium album]|uniref:Bacterial SCP orthologue domain-containing protein n=1 Tax=Sinosporangium album TaxID=504805 RepID=A0A1G8H3S1_9ACTN|nr:sterol carrier family protein [Sinosporangium album]SDI01277.1 hypothetical protein SAMN05421505_13051 [Sinosporangium album]